MATSLAGLLSNLRTMFGDLSVSGLRVNVLPSPPDKVNRGDAWIEVTDYNQTTYGHRRVELTAYFQIGPLTSRSRWYPQLVELLDELLDVTKLEGDPVTWTTIRPAVSEVASVEFLSVQALGYGVVDRP